MATVYTRIQTANSDLNRVQDSINTAIQNIGMSPFVGGTLLASVQIDTTVTAIPHKLSYTPTNVFVGPPNENTIVWMPAVPGNSFIYLQAGSTCLVNIWVK